MRCYTIIIGFSAVVLLLTLVMAVHVYVGSFAGYIAFWGLVALLAAIRRKRGSFGIFNFAEAYAAWEKGIRDKIGR